MTVQPQSKSHGVRLERHTATALRFAVAYTLLAAAWFYVSDRVAIFHTPESLRWWWLVKEWAFVSVTAVAIFIGVRRIISQSHAAYVKAAEAKERFRALIAASSTVVWRAAADGRPLDSIPDRAEYTGMPDEQFARPHGWREAFHADDRERVSAEWQDAIKQGSEFRTEYRMRRRDGSWRSMRAHAVPVRDEQGNIREWFGIDTDVTEQKAATDALRLQSHVLNSIGDAVIVSDTAGKVIYMNRAAEQLYQWHADDAVGRDVTTLNVPDESLSDAEEIMNALRAGGTWTGEFPVHDRTGRHFTIEATMTALRDGAGKVTALIGVSRDVTERKAAVAELEKRRVQLEQAQAIAGMGSWEWDMRTDELRWSTETRRIFGVDSDAPARLDTFRALIHPDDLPHTDKAIADALHNTGSYDCVYRVVRSDGTTRMIHARGRFFRDASGEPVRAYGINHDITEQHAAQAALENYREELRALAERAIDVREEEAIRISRELHDELGQALTRLTFDVADVQSRVDRLPFNGERRAVDARLQQIARGLHETIETTRRICTELRPAILDQLGLAAAIEWQTKEFEAHTAILCDLLLPEEELAIDDTAATATFRIFQELLTNVARHANATEARIELTVSNAGLELVVADNGRGIAQDEIERPSGLGLLGVRERAHAAGGDVTIRRNEPRGTIARLRLPIGKTQPWQSVN